MSDYLNNLVARALNLTPVVQPRLTSLFEPSVGGGVARSFKPETARESLTSREQSHQPSLAWVEPAPAPLFQPLTPISVERGEGEVGPKPRSRFESFQLHEEHREAESKEQPPPRAAALVQAPLLSVPMAPPSAPPASSVVIGSLTQSSVAEQNAQTDSAQPQPSGSASDIFARVEPAPAQPLRPSTPAIIVRQPNTSPIMPTRRVMKPTAEAVEPQTISVTIGRIDVRAVFPQPPAPRVSRTERPAAMSLDEYLKQRSGGRR